MSYSKPEQMNDQEFYISVLQGQTAALPCRVQSVPPPTLRSGLNIFHCFIKYFLSAAGSMSTATCYSRCLTTQGSTRWPTCCWSRTPRRWTGASTGARPGTRWGSSVSRFISRSSLRWLSVRISLIWRQHACWLYKHGLMPSNFVIPTVSFDLFVWSIWFWNVSKQHLFVMSRNQ